MLIQFALTLSVVMQFGAAIIAVSLIRRTRFNISWILLSSAFVLMALRRVNELYEACINPMQSQFTHLSSWIAVIISLLIFSGTLFILQIFNAQRELDKMKSEQETKVLNAIISTEEKSKREFARNLHDGLAPILSSIKILLSSIDKTNLKPRDQEVIHRSENGMNEAIMSLKTTANNLSPHILESFGLLKALEHIADQFQTSEKFSITIHENIAQQRFKKQTELASYRILCELLNNSAKHSNATKVCIQVIKESKVLRIIYTDNGKGFLHRNGKNLGMGLSNIASRVKAENGTIEIHSKPSKGFYADINLQTT